MAVNENIKKGAYYRHCTGFDPEGNPVYTRISFWTDANDVKFDDGRKLDSVISQLNTDVDKLEGVVLTGTLISGQTTLDLSNSQIKTDNSVKYRYYTSKYGVSPKDVNINDGTMSMIFKAQNENILVRVEILDV